MGRHIGALRHVTNVTQVTLIHHFPVLLARNPVHLTRLALINQIKKAWERITKAHAATASVADVKHPLHLVKTGFLVVKRL